MYGVHGHLGNVVNCRSRCRLLRGRIFGQLALKGPAVDTEKLRSLGYIPIAVGENTLDVLPFDSGEGWHGGWGLASSRVRTEFRVGVEDLLSVSRFCEVMVSPELQGLHRSGNASVTGQHDYRDGRVDLLNILNEIQPAEIGHLQIQQNEIRTDTRDKAQTFFFRAGFMGFALAIAKSPAEPVSENLIVVYDDDSRTIGWNGFKYGHFAYWGAAEWQSNHDRARTRMTTRRRVFARKDKPGMRRGPFPAQ